MNTEHRTLNVEHRIEDGHGERRSYDLEERLLVYSVRIIRLTEALPDTRAGNHIAGQLLRSGTSPLSNHGESQAAESRADFIHKLKVCLKELRESHRWLRLIEQVPLIKPAEKLTDLLRETDELVRIFVKSIQTAEQRSPTRVSKFSVRR